VVRRYPWARTFINFIRLCGSGYFLGSTFAEQCLSHPGSSPLKSDPMPERRRQALGNTRDQTDFFQPARATNCKDAVGVSFATKS